MKTGPPVRDGLKQWFSKGVLCNFGHYIVANNTTFINNFV
jgi:hypothetical protein